MSTQSWLTLMEYSAKYRVSLSTLRRRIKNGEVEHKFNDGKYLLKDSPTQEVASAESGTIAPPTQVSSSTQSDPMWMTTQGLLNEIKKAYSLILQEKEEQILQLKEEVSDLKTLARILEEENNRIKNLQPKLNFDLGLEL